MNPEMTPYRVALCRGGTSKAVFMMRNELPRDPEQRDRVIRAVFGSPDPRQIDGLGGADVLTSKFAMIGPPTRPDADVDYTFAQVSFDTDFVDYGGNCGNISSAVGPFAIDEGLVEAVEPVTTVRIHQTNTHCILTAYVPVKDGKAQVLGDCRIDGVPGTGARILLDFSDTAGSTTGKVLPTGHPTDRITVDGEEYEISIVDAGNVVVFLEAARLGLTGTESCAQIEKDPALMARIEAIRAHAAVLAGMARTPQEATEKSAYVPFFSLVSPAQSYWSVTSGIQVEREQIDLTARLYFMGHMHKAYPGTGSVATGAAARIPGTLVDRQLTARGRENGVLRIGHPGGVMCCDAVAEEGPEGRRFTRLAYERTARRILEGTCYVRNDRL